MVGSRLSLMLQERGYEVSILSRTSQLKHRTYKWDIAKGMIDEAVFTDHDYIIHLAGAGVADHRWTASYKKQIYDSRIHSTRLLVDRLNTLSNVRIKKFIAASAIGIYGNRVTTPATEDAPAADTFLANVCADWEAEAKRCRLPTAIIRVGVVLAKEGGFIPQISKPMKFYAGTVLGSGKQMLSWIHIDDLCNMFIEAVKNSEIVGVYNGVAPEAVSHADITYKMANRLRVPILLPNVPSWVLKLMLGEMHTMILANQQVSARKWIDRGFGFQYPDIDSALDNLIRPLA